MNIKVKIEEIIYEVEIEDINSLPVIAHIGEETFEVWPELSNEPARPQHKVQRHTNFTGMQSKREDSIIPAPLPGTIGEIFVQPGQKVSEGDPLFIIEAMKMKNSIRSGRGGTVKSIMVKTGETVKHHQPMIEISE